MSNVSMTYDQIEGSSYYALGCISSLRRRIELSRLHVRGLFCLITLDFCLRRITSSVTTGAFEQLDPEQKASTLKMLNEVNEQGWQVIDMISVRKVPFGWGPVFRRVQESADNLDNVVESLQIANDAKLRGMIEKSLNALQSSEKAAPFASMHG